MTDDGDIPKQRASRTSGLAAVNRLLAEGRLGMAVELATETLNRPQAPLPAARLRLALAQALLLSGRPAEAAVAVDALRSATTLPANQRRHAGAVHLLAVSAFDARRAGSLARALLAHRRPRLADAAVAAAVLSEFTWDAGDAAEALRLAHQAADGSRSAPPVCRQFVLLTLASRLAERGEVAGAEALIDEAHGATWPALGAWAAIARAGLLARLGHLAEARAEATTALAGCADLGAELLAPLAAAVLTRVALRTGDLLAAAHHVRRHGARPAAGGVAAFATRFDWYALVLAAEQDGARIAVSALAELTPGLLLEEPGAAAWLVRLATAAGDPRLRQQVIALAERVPELAVDAAHARALADADPDALARCVTDHRDGWAAALAAEDLGALLAVRGDDAVGHLQSAVERFDELGAARDADRVRSRLRSLGERPRPRAERQASSDGLESLSLVERTIAHLIGQAFTDQQIATRVFLSRHTVNYHLRQIYRKLGINSRVQLAWIIVAINEPPDEQQDTTAVDASSS
jgi:ATP/maltotriose-dependent transcriptional regulator MalT